ncbi:hypothetical protein OfM1_14590 [Lactovum odontotermitis]
MKKLITKLMLVLAVFGFVGGATFTPLAQTAAAEEAKSRVWVGQVNTIYEVAWGSDGKLLYGRWYGPQEVRCSNGYYLVTKNYEQGPRPGGGYFERTYYNVVTY